MSKLYKKIEVPDYLVQSKVAKIQIKILAVLWLIIGFMIVFNRYTYSKKHIETEYYNANLTDVSVNRIVSAHEAMTGDEQIIKNYLAKYVQYRESKLMDLDAAKFGFIKALSSYDVYWRYEDSEKEFYLKNREYVRRVQVDPAIKKLDEGLFQIKFETREIKNLRDAEVFKTYQVATIRYQIIDSYEENDDRVKIEDFARLNPLRIEITIYSTANYNFEKRN